jgi:hypothetical protein
MASHSGRGSRRSRGGSRKRGDYRPRSNQTGAAAAPQQKSVWQKIVGFFGGNGTKQIAPAAQNGAVREPKQPLSQPRPSRKPEQIEVTSPRLYVGNLSFDATESDLFELFNGVGHVQNAEVVTYKHNQRSKGFAFVQMQSLDEAQRAVSELHDKEFLGRKLVVSGAKSAEHHSA